MQDSAGSLNRTVIHRDHVWHVENPKPEEVEKSSYVCCGPRCVHSKSQFSGHLHLLQT